MNNIIAKLREMKKINTYTYLEIKRLYNTLKIKFYDAYSKINSSNITEAINAENEFEKAIEEILITIDDLNISNNQNEETKKNPHI